MKFYRDIVVYIPTYQCTNTIKDVLIRIPSHIQARCEILVIDNCSSDSTREIIRECVEKNLIQAPLHLILPESNLGYAGSQKLAYGILRNQKSVKHVMMLHGDGQYAPEQLDVFMPYIGKSDLVYGYRSKKDYPKLEQTPFITWAVIKSLGIIESAITGHFSKEWHTGFVMYSTSFLRRIKLSALTTTPHIDGHLQFTAGKLRQTIFAVPIFKLYKDLQPFEGAARRKYVFDVLKLMLVFRSTRDELELKSPSEEILPIYADAILHKTEDIRTE